MAELYVSIRNIADRVMRHPLLSDVTFGTIVLDTVDFMRIVGVPRMFIEKTETIEIKNGRGKLPCDFVELMLLKVIGQGHEVSLRESTDSYHLEIETTDRRNLGHSYDSTFRIQSDLIYTSFKEGTIVVAYRAIEVDDDGYPKLPDSPNFLRALESYIKKQHFSILFDLGKINQAVYLKTELEYAWNVGSCISDMNKLTLSQAESFFNSFSTLIVRANEFKRGFANNGAKELIRKL